MTYADSQQIITLMRENQLLREALEAIREPAESAAEHFIDQEAHDHGWPIELKAALYRFDTLGRRVTTPS